MKAHLMYRDRDFDVQKPLPSNAETLTQDLELNLLIRTMAQGDSFLAHVAQQGVLSGLQDDVETILYRQAILKDCLRNHSIVKAIYDIAIEAIEAEKKQWFGIFSSYPGSILYGAVELMDAFIGILRKLRLIAEERAPAFRSEGFTAFFAMIRTELTDEYFDRIKTHLKELRFKEGVLISAELGKGNAGIYYVLRKYMGKRPSWIERIFSRHPPAYSFRIPERDEAGARALSLLRNQGINLVANALAQSANHILSFFVMLRTELAFYMGCVNLERMLHQRETPTCFPVPTPPGTRQHSCVGLRDACLALSLEKKVVGNELEANGKNLVLVTGANQGGKSTFLRSIGLAQLMMQCGMFVTAESFRADTVRGLFTHYKREEDASMESGKFDEELSRMSGIVDTLIPDSMLLFNESFAATNEREGSEVASQIVSALLETPIKVFFVTHLYQFGHELWEDKQDNALFLRAERRPDGQRTFKVVPGEPIQTSYGIDLYEKIFNSAAKSAETGSS